MKGYIQIAHRATGKTERAIYEFMKDPKDTLLVAPKYSLVGDIVHKITNRYKLSEGELFIIRKNVCAYSDEVLRGREFKKVIFDELFLFTKPLKPSILVWSELIDIAGAMEKEVYIFSTHHNSDWRKNKDGKKFVKRLVRKNGFKKLPNLRTTNPNIVRTMEIDKFGRKFDELTEKAKKIGYKLVPIDQPVPRDQKIQNTIRRARQLTFDFDPNSPKQQSLFD